MLDASHNSRNPEYLKKFYELSSAFFCEAAVLIIVFGFLEKILKNESVGMVYSCAVLLVTVGSFMVGFLLAILRNR